MRKFTKHLVYAFLLALFSGGTVQAQYQLPNSGFEEWESQTINDIPKALGGTKSNTATEPVSWNGFGTAKASSSTTAAAISNSQLLKEATEKKSGSYSAKIESRNVIIAVANGNLTTGRIHAGNIDPKNSANNNATLLNDPKFSATFVGLPDTLRVWVKYVPAQEKASKGENISRVSAILHDNTSVQDPGGDNSHMIGAASLDYPAVKDDNGYTWQHLAIPFSYDKELYTSQAQKPSYALVTFTTNKTPGEGSPKDVVYIDDIEMIYNSKLESILYKDEKVLGIDKDNSECEVIGTYERDCLTAYADGKGAKVTVTYDDATKTAKIRIEGNNISEDPTNYHEYTVKFTTSKLKSLYYNGRMVEDFNPHVYEYALTGTYGENAVYGQTAPEGSYDVKASGENTASILVKGENYTDEDPSDSHTYTLTFTPATPSTEKRTQLLNSGFEEWEDVVGNGIDFSTFSLGLISGSEPLNWNSFLTVTGNGDGFASWGCANKLNSSSDVRPGSEGTKSAKIFSNMVMGAIAANGNMTTGRMFAGDMDAANAAKNFNRTEMYDPGFNSRFTGMPDSVSVWVKYIPNAGEENEETNKWNARVSAVLHDSYAYQDPIPAELDEEMASHRVAIAEMNYPSTEGAWKKLSIPFVYTGNEAKPAYVLVSFTTNMTPGKGSGQDTVYVDDMQMIYNSQLDSIKYNGVKLSGFDKNKTEYIINDFYTDGCLKAFADGKGATVTIEYTEGTDETYESPATPPTAVVRVTGNDIDNNAQNYHEYTIKFYPSQLTNLQFNGRLLEGFSKDKYEYEVSGTYAPYVLYTIPEGVDVEDLYDYDEATSTQTYKVMGRNIEEDASNFHEYKIKFVPASASTEERTQLLNSDFEDWENISGLGTDFASLYQVSGSEPLGWNSFLTACGGVAPFSTAEKLVISSDVRPNSNGSNSAKIFSNLVLGSIVANGNMTTGRINAGGFSPTDATGNYNYTSMFDPDFNSRFTGMPDSLTVWVKYITDEKPGKGDYMARVNAVLHSANTYQDPIPDPSNMSEADLDTYNKLTEEQKQVYVDMLNYKVASAEMNYPSTGGVWKKLSIPFQYTNNGAKPAYALVSFTTNMTPGNGSAMDTVYVDDMEMIYNSQLDSIKYNDAKIAEFGKDKFTYEVIGAYTQDCLDAYADGKGAKTTITYDEAAKTATIRVEGNDIRDNDTNYHEYKVLFKSTDGVDEVSANGTIKLYRIDDATIGLTGVEAGEDFCIYSQNGTLVLESKLETGIISVKNLVNGMYILKVAGKNITFIR